MPNHYVSELGSNAREESIGLLKAALSNALDLQMAIKQAHWTIKGPSFIGLHELLDQVAGRCFGHSDGDNGDEDTADLFTEISRTIDKDAWFVGAHNG